VEVPCGGLTRRVVRPDHLLPWVTSSAAAASNTPPTPPPHPETRGSSTPRNHENTGANRGDEACSTQHLNFRGRARTLHFLLQHLYRQPMMTRGPVEVWRGARSVTNLSCI
jgi:hypothetical protein